MSRKWILILTHILGSSIFLFLPVIGSPDFSLRFSFLKIPPFQQDFLSYVLLLLFFYLNYYVLVPQLYLHKKWWWFILALLACYCCIRFLPQLIIQEDFALLQNRSLFYRQGMPPPTNLFPMFIRHYTFQFLIVGLFSLFLKIYSQWKQMEQEKTILELRYLRAQINPHFLFNTLNVIYASSIEEKATKTSTSILQLSTMLRHVLNESQKNYISLEQEMVYIQSYIALQSERCSETTHLSVKIEGDFTNLQIPPLLLIPFIENAFKYGISPVETSTIAIQILVEESHLKMDIVNDKVRTQHELTVQGGIGLKNTIDRLNRLYPSSHTLVLQDTARSFTVSLELLLEP